MAEIRANGVRFHVQRIGGSGGSPVVFVHGLVMDNLSSFYYTLANPVAAAGADVILYDLRGHGHSERPRAGYAVEDAVADLAALLDALGVDGPVHLVGNSYGGTVALAFAVAYPQRTASLALIEAHLAVEGWGAQMADALTEVAFGLTATDLDEWQAQLGRKLGRMARTADDLLKRTTLVDDLMAVKPLTPQALRAITGPVLAIYGERSDIRDHAAALELHVPRCKLIVIPDCTHSVLMEATATIRELLLDWLR